MAGDIVNLRLARKRKARQEKEAHAAENRVRFGRTRHERTLADAERDIAARRLDLAQRADDKCRDDKNDGDS